MGQFLTKKRVLIGGGLVALGAGAAIAWWLLSPLFINKTVDEEFPFAASAVVPSGMTRQEVEDTMATLSKVDQPMTEPMPGDMMDSTGIELAPGVVKLRTGNFRDADRFHKGSGTATIYRGPDGSLLLRLEDFRVTNGPDLHVIITPHPNPKGSSEVKTEGYLDLGKLKGNIGGQNYEIPDGVGAADIGAVVIYCNPFNVVFSVAPLADAG